MSDQDIFDNLEDITPDVTHSITYDTMSKDSIRDSTVSNMIIEQLTIMITKPAHMINISDDQEIVDLKPYYGLTIKEAAKQLGISASVLSKRWTIASRGRRWPRLQLKRLLTGLGIHINNRNLRDAEKVKNMIDELTVSRYIYIPKTPNK